MSHPAHTVGDFEVCTLRVDGYQEHAVTESIQGSKPRLQTISWALPEVDKQRQQSPGMVHDPICQVQPQGSMTGVSNLTDSPVQTSPVGFSSTETSPVDHGPASTTLPATETLKDQLNRAFLKSPYGAEKPFLPVNDLERIVNIDNVSRYCSTHAASLPGNQIPRIIDYVFGPQTKGRGFARHVFAILVLMDQPARISGVVDQDIRDRDLPLAQCDKQGTDYQLARRTDMLMKPIDCFRTWTLPERRTFDEIQFQVKPPVFKPLERNRAFAPPEFVAMKLDNRNVLPFTLYDGKRQIVSGGSKVVRIKIHPAHHDFDKKVSPHNVFGTDENYSLKHNFLPEIRKMNTSL